MRRKWTGIPACLVLWDRLSFVCPLCVCGCAASGQAGMPVLFCRTDILVCPPCVCGCAASGQAFLPVLFCRTDILLSVHFVFADAPQVDRQECLSYLTTMITCRSRAPSNSQRKIPCQRPSSNFPSLKGTVTDEPTRVALMWASEFS